MSLDNLTQSKRNRRIKNTFKVICKVVFMSFLAMILLFPFFVMVSRSLMTEVETVTVPAKLFPEKLHFENYKNALDPKMLGHFKNTAIVLVFNMIGVPLSSYLVAFGFAKNTFAGQKPLFSLGMATIMLPSIATTIPLYVLYNQLGWLNTFYPLIIPQCCGGGMVNIFLTYNFLKSVPNTYMEAAKIDGASVLRIAFNIALPLVKPVVILIMVNSFMAAWNDFSGPLTYIDVFHSDKWTATVAIFYNFRGKTEIEAQYNIQSALCVIMMIPSLILFGFFQKSLINGVHLSGIKG